MMRIMGIDPGFWDEFNVPILSQWWWVLIKPDTGLQILEEKN